MDVSIVVHSEDSSGALSQLREWLLEDEELRGRVQQVQLPPQSGTLGAIAGSLAVALGTGGVLTVTARALSTVLTTWLRCRCGEVVVTLTMPDGAKLEYKATNVRTLSAGDIDSTTKELSDQLTKHSEPGGGMELST